MRTVTGITLAAACGTAAASGVTAAGLEEVVVNASRIVLTGRPRAASEGTVLREQLENRPLLRTGELLEVVPGLIVTQHTGDGKANQYFLRGFNLDHGTDFLTRVEGMAVNMPTHGHGQGYMDLNFVIPELVESVVYHKGTYYPELGNFSAAGAADLRYLDRLRPFVSVSGGEDNNDHLKLRLGLYNAFDSDASDIRYYYESRLPGEAAPVADIHLHPVEPRTLRLTVEAHL